MLESALGAWPENGCVQRGLGALRIQQGRTQEVKEVESVPGHTHKGCGFQHNMGVFKGLHPLEGCGHHTHRGCGLINESVVLLQAVGHLRVAAEASEGAEERVDALHLLGGALKDLGDLDQAEKVRVQSGMGGADPSH